MSNMRSKSTEPGRRKKQPKPVVPVRTRRSPAITAANKRKRQEREAKRQQKVAVRHNIREFDGKPVPTGHAMRPRMAIPQYNLAFFTRLRAVKQQARKLAAVRVRKNIDASMFSISERVASLHPEFVEALK